MPFGPDTRTGLRRTDSQPSSVVSPTTVTGTENSEPALPSLADPDVGVASTPACAAYCVCIVHRTLMSLRCAPRMVTGSGTVTDPVSGSGTQTSPNQTVVGVSFSERASRTRTSPRAGSTVAPEADVMAR